MPLQRDTSSAVYWQDAGLDDLDIDEAVLMDLEHKGEGMERIANEHQHGLEKVHEESAGTLGSCSTLQRARSDNVSTSINQQVNKQEALTTKQASNVSSSSSVTASLANDQKDVRGAIQSVENDDDEEEITFNPDMELQDAQAAQHGYESAQFYEKINFGEFSKYMANKRRKLGVQQGAFKLNAKEGETSSVLKGLRIHVSSGSRASHLDDTLTG